MVFDWWTFALQTANFAILVWLLHRFLYKPVLRMVDARRAGIEQERAAAAEALQSAEAARKAADAERIGIEAERREILAAARAEAETAAGKKIAEATKEADGLRAQAKKGLVAEREAASEQIRKATLDLGMDIARRLLDELPLEYRTEAWLHRIEQHLTAMPEVEKAALLEGVDGKGGLKVIGTAPFPEDVAAHWRDRLQAQFGGTLQIEFADDPDLVAGVELHFPTAILHFSWRSALENIRTEIEDGV